MVFVIVQNTNSPVSGRREDTLYQPSNDESLALGQLLQQLVEEVSSSRFICLIDEQQYHTQLWVVDESCRESTTNMGDW